MALIDKTWAPATFAPLPSGVRTKAITAANNCVNSRVTWVSSTFPGTGAITFGGIGEADIREPASIAFSLAVLLTTGTYDATGTGIDTATATTTAVRLITSLAATHTGNAGGAGWGGATITGVIDPQTANPIWQSALWVSLAGAAGWLLRSSLTPGQWAQVQNMVVSEANRFIGYAVPYWRNSAGVTITKGDTKAEENPWHAATLWLACAILPQHANAPTWIAKAIELSAAATATPSDPTATKYLHGIRLRSLVSGSNLEWSGLLENHGFMSPNYVAATAQNMLNGLIFARKASVVPAACLHHADLIYRGMVDAQIAGPPLNSPGGTIYTPGSYAVYYPASNEGDPDRMASFCAIDGLTHCLGQSGLASVPASTWADRHFQRQLDMQADGTSRRGYWDMVHACWVIYATGLVASTPGLADSNDTAAQLLTRAGSNVT